MPDPHKLPSPQAFPSFRRAALGLFVGVTAAAWFGWDLQAERHFVDESAYVAQSSYGDLYLAGRWDHPAWLEYAAYDLPPLPKYLIGVALWGGGYRRPDLDSARRWYGTGLKSEFAGTPQLIVARRPAVVLGALGCVAIFGIGTRSAGPAAGWLAAVLLAVNPLYRMHARRAMSDVPAEAFLLVALALGLSLWLRAARGACAGRWWLTVGMAGAAVGLATLSKLNGVLGGLVLGGWVGLALASRRFPRRAVWALGGATAVAAAVAFGTFVALNPYLTARPPGPAGPAIAPEAAKSFAGRVGTVYDHRAAVSRLAMASFPHNALPSLADRASAVAVQGFGRFGPLGPRGWTDSTIRYDWRQDWGAVAWGPLVALALGVLALRGGRDFSAGRPPVAWLPVAYFVVVVAVVTPFIPLAWDRYFLAIQAPAALAVACAAGLLLDRRPTPAEDQG